MSTDVVVRELLVELLVEELPPKALRRLGLAFASAVAESLKLQGLLTSWEAFFETQGAASDQVSLEPNMQWFATPRRLAVYLKSVFDKGPDRRERIRLMPVAVGLNGDHTPTPALQKKLQGLAASFGDVERLPDEKGEFLYLVRTSPGKTLAEGLQAALDSALAALPIPKVMQYQLSDGWTTVQFVRPAHRLVALHGSDVVPVKALGLEASRVTQGHRFEATRPTIELRGADSYAAQLAEEGAVMASFDARRAEIFRQLHAVADVENLEVLGDSDLLDEVTALVERPNVFACEFEPEFLEVPQECLILTMKANQKYFPLLEPTGVLSNRFLIVSNIAPADPSRVIEGNERVVRPRLADAKFFYDQDRRNTLASRLGGLDRVVYHGKLGSQGERMRRVQAIAGALAKALGADDMLAGQADRAALLAKADLLTEMVGEFPELQGTMGRYYALNDGEDIEVATAIEDHYKPRFARDDLPRTEAGAIVAVADKLETLVGLFGIDQRPTGDKDPFALRRHALGVLRILSEKLPALTLDRAVDIGLTAPAWPSSHRHVLAVAGSELRPLRSELLEFFADRLSANLTESGWRSEEIAAVLADDKYWWLAELEPRLNALRQFAALPEAAALAAANKRVGNILKKSSEPVGSTVDAALLKEPAEAALDAALRETGARADAAFEARDYAGSLRALASLRAPVDAFFESVMVNADDPALRANRLALLARLHAAMNRVADLSRLAA